MPPLRDFAVWVTPRTAATDHERELVRGIWTVRLNWTFDFTFIPLEPPMAPPFPTDRSAWAYPRWEAPIDARLEAFYDARFVITASDLLAGQDFRYPADRNSRNDPDGHVFYTSTEHYRTLSADLGELVQTHSARKFTERALALQGRPVVDFLVDRLQASRLVPERVLLLLGLERSPDATGLVTGEDGS